LSTRNYWASLSCPGAHWPITGNGKKEYEMFVARLPTALDAAILLPDWDKSLAGSKLIPSFGGYSARTRAVLSFVFAKGVWIAGIAGCRKKRWMRQPYSGRTAQLKIDLTSQE